MQKFLKLSKRGFTLIELMIVVVIIGILASLAIYGVQKYVSNSKSAEARMMLGRMAKDQLTYFEGETQSYKVLSLGATAGISRALCPPAANVPTGAAPQKNEKYQPNPSEFDQEGWACLQTTVTTPIYYQYAMTSSQAATMYTAGTMVPAKLNDAFEATAKGDLDGDTKTSLFAMGGAVKGTTTQMTLVLATTIKEVSPEE